VKMLRRRTVTDYAALSCNDLGIMNMNTIYGYGYGQGYGVKVVLQRVDNTLCGLDSAAGMPLLDNTNGVRSRIPEHGVCCIEVCFFSGGGHAKCPHLPTVCFRAAPSSATVLAYSRYC
jgi:hypothetical protein